MLTEYATFEVSTNGVTINEYEKYERMINDEISTFMVTQTKYKTELEKAAFAECFRSCAWARIASNEPERFKHSFLSN